MGIKNKIKKGLPGLCEAVLQILQNSGFHTSIIKVCVVGADATL